MSAVTTIKVGDRVHLAGGKILKKSDGHVYEVVDILNQPAAGHWGEVEFAAIRDLTASNEPGQVVETGRLTPIDQ